MENLKIRVNNADESKEIQNILESKGLKKWKGWSKLGSIGGFIWTDTDMAYCDNKIEYFDESPRKEITLSELREMADPMKEYINKTTGEYRKTSEVVSGEQWMGIPSDAEYLTKCIDNNNDTWFLFWKGNYKICVGHDDDWCDFEADAKEYLSRWSARAHILWQRHTQPESLPFVDDEPSLNDQYAEIEQVRQAIKVKSGSNSDHALDAMSFGLIGAGAAQASGGAKMRENNHYFIDVSDVDEVDFYEIAKRYNVTDPAVQHILKKCLAIGNRGHKDLETDLKDILKTAKRALQINGFGE